MMPATLRFANPTVGQNRNMVSQHAVVEPRERSSTVVDPQSPVNEYYGERVLKESVFSTPTKIFHSHPLNAHDRERSRLLGTESNSYDNGGEKSVRTRKVESTLSTSLPFSSDFSWTLFHSGSS